MNEFIEKLIERLEELETYAFTKYPGGSSHRAYSNSIEIVKSLAAEYNDGWIPCSERLPTVETEVLIVATRKWRDGTVKYIITTAMYEDGTVLENDSCWNWECIDGEWNEEEECYIIPEGWWENKHYNGYDEFNNAVDDEVIAWQLLPKPYREKGEKE